MKMNGSGRYVQSKLTSFVGFGGVQIFHNMRYYTHCHGKVLLYFSN